MSRFIRNLIDNHSHLRLTELQAINLQLNRMYVCICNAITEKQIRRAAKSGAQDLWGLQRELGVASNCGSCKEAAMDILREESATFFEPKVYVPGIA
jgi:bacterioferritin-associated ferredoxin